MRTVRAVFQTVEVKNLSLTLTEVVMHTTLP